MDKKCDLMNPDGFSHFNGPIFSLLLWMWHGVWPQVGPIYYVLVVTCDYFYGPEKLVSMEYKFPKKCLIELI